MRDARRALADNAENVRRIDELVKRFGLEGWSMIPKQHVPDLDPEDGNRFSDKIMRKQKRVS